MSPSAYSGAVRWTVILHPSVAEWISSSEILSETDRRATLEALAALEIVGPVLGRPLVDRVKGSRFANMKELRPLGTHLRLLFAFDPERHAVVLVAGDKAGQWQRWYRANIPIADARFDEHLRSVQ